MTTNTPIDAARSGKRAVAYSYVTSILLKWRGSTSTENRRCVAIVLPCHLLRSALVTSTPDVIHLICNVLSDLTTATPHVSKHIFCQFSHLNFRSRISLRPPRGLFPVSIMVGQHSRSSFVFFCFLMILCFETSYSWHLSLDYRCVCVCVRGARMLSKS